MTRGDTDGVRGVGVRRACGEATPWGRFLGHAVDCADCRAGRRCAVGNGHAVREARRAPMTGCSSGASGLLSRLTG
ncbi:hypothetical protein [Streptomyces sp. NPDC021212]|uniref:hypothetical protein n=1 Tax=Streptomyces sp. NPDC021212 TaxID=3365118 RepID=UPI00379AFE1F